MARRHVARRHRLRAAFRPPTTPGHPEAPERAEVMDVIAQEGLKRAMRSWRRGRRRREPLLRGTAPSTYAGLLRRPAPRWRSTPTPRHRPIPMRSRFSPRVRASRWSNARSAAWISARWRSSARGSSRRAQPRHGLLPVQQRGGWRGTGAASGSDAWPSSTTTSTTATPRSTCSRPIRRCCTVAAPVSVLSGTGAAAKSAGAAPASPSTPARGGRSDEDYRRVR